MRKPMARAGKPVMAAPDRMEAHLDLASMEIAMARGALGAGDLADCRRRMERARAVLSGAVQVRKSA